MNWAAALDWLKGFWSTVWGVIGTGAFWIGIGLPMVLIYLNHRRRGQSTSVSVGIPFGLGSTTYDTTPADRIVAWKLYVQLVTRKAALPFDSDADLVVDVFDSLFELFPISRTLLSDLPPRHYERDGGVASLVIRVLNDGLRPSLTRWQSGFRQWWTEALEQESNKGTRPQDIQRQFPQYDELVKDLRVMNTELGKFADELFEIASVRPRRQWRRERIRPVAPSLDESLDVASDHATSLLPQSPGGSASTKTS